MRAGSLTEDPDPDPAAAFAGGSFYAVKNKFSVSPDGDSVSGAAAGAAVFTFFSIYKDFSGT